MTDFELLRDYVDRGSEPAFAVLVKRYANLVYSAASRQADGPQNADEIAQAVFIILARKARELTSSTLLAAWLLRTTRFVALNARRRQFHRIKIEQEAMHATSGDPDSTWQRIAPSLDEALLTLNDQDRTVLVLRFFQEKSFKEIGAAMGVTDDAAQKRAARALEKLRKMLSRSGILVPSTLLCSILASRAIQATSPSAATRISAALTNPNAPAAALARDTISTWPAGRASPWLFPAAAAALICLAAVAIAMAIAAGQRGPAAQLAAAKPVVNALANDATAEKPPDAANGRMRFRVLDEKTDAPIGSARLVLTWEAGLLERMTNLATTDKDGVALLSFEPVQVLEWDYRVEVLHDGFVPKYVSWSEIQGDAFSQIPLEYTTKLTPAVPIGGVVVNAENIPLPKARIIFNFLGGRQTIERERLTLGRRYHVEATDETGQWRCTHVPEQISMIEFSVRHTEYASKRFGSATLGPASANSVTHLALAELRHGKAIMKLQKGAAIAGVVQDASGNPVPGAKVTFNHEFWEPTANQLTGPDGRFRFGNADLPEAASSGLDHNYYLTAQASGFAPTDLKLKAPEIPSESRIVLMRGGPLRGRVVNEKAEPIRFATVELCSHSNVKFFEWKAVTDEQGRFEWLSAPTNASFYVVDAPGHAPIPEMRWVADGSEHLVTLQRVMPVHCFGTVLDAETRQPIDSFEVWMGGTENAHTGYGRLMSKQRVPQLRTTGRSGAFSFTNRFPFVTYSLEIRARGYFQATQTQRGPLSPESEFTVLLERSSSFDGIVKSPDGKPVRGALAILCTEKNSEVYSVPIRGGARFTLPGEFDPRYSQGTSVLTDDQGRFSMLARPNAAKVIVAHRSGFGSISTAELRKSSTVTLAPWGRISGILMVGSQPGADQSICLQEVPEDWMGYTMFLETRTDANGRFTFDGIPPGSLAVTHRLAFRDGQAGPIPLSQRTLITVSSGKATEVTLGGRGRKIIGIVKLPGPDREMDWRRDVQWLHSKSPSGLTAPDRNTFNSDAAFSEAMTLHNDRVRAFFKSPAGIEHQRNRRSYVLEFSQDGSFKIDDVLPGTYELDLKISDGKSRPMSYGLVYIPFASLRKEILIPEAEDSPKEFNVGTLEPK